MFCVSVSFLHGHTVVHFLSTISHQSNPVNSIAFINLYLNFISKKYGKKWGKDVCYWLKT